MPDSFLFCQMSFVYFEICKEDFVRSLPGSLLALTSLNYAWQDTLTQTTPALDKVFFFHNRASHFNTSLSLRHLQLGSLLVNLFEQLFNVQGSYLVFLSLDSSYTVQRV